MLAGTNSIELLERPAEVRRIVESPKKRNFRDAFLCQPRIGEIAMALAQPPLANPIRNRAPLARENAMYVPHGNPHG